MDNYLWEIFSTTSKVQNIEDHDLHNHQLLQIPFQLNGFCQQGQIHQDLKRGPQEIRNNTILDDNTNKGQRLRQEKNMSTSCDGSNEVKIKKVLHRNIERHRRQEMAKLLASLRSLLPIELMKGKRSASDHMQIAVNYIRHLQNNIQELGNTRKKIENSSLDFGAENGSSSESCVQNCVTVNPCEDGMEILINSHKEEMFPLSKVLRGLVEEGLNVVTCVNSKQDDWTLIRIQCQVSSDISGISAVGLQKKLDDVIN